MVPHPAKVPIESEPTVALIKRDTIRDQLL
jgi:hypothetical protein